MEAIMFLALSALFAGYQNNVLFAGKDFDIPVFAPAITKSPIFK